MYRVPPAPGRRATLDNLRATLAAMTAAAVEHNGDMTCAALPHFEAIEERKRDEMLALCAVVKWHLAGAEDGGG
ncbi:hypothetical protein G4G27_14345 [Sphingomonas sp. So64.6b]|uniref:hypothetical protein n=1 Tax=Sphingomonas sp. So64.6b TaxID=2997354 RepID=UPI00160423DB|nr:hypothetical protein [Sphingomonas sp. So64.6b]QNA85043.1 hypothetical protein G4G27_14345 [Sphingomonas sp. So64.6b]